MSASVPPKAHQDAALAVFRDTSLTIQQRLDTWDFAAGREIINRLTAFLRKNRAQLGDIPFGLELTQKTDAAKPELTAKAIAAANASQASLMTLDSELRVLTVIPLNCGAVADETVFSAASAGTVIAHYENRALVRLYANGFTARCINLDEPTSSPGRVVRMRYGAEQYRLAIRDHYRNSVKYWQDTDHWAKKPERKLYSRLGSSTKTEHIFHRSLARWLEAHLDADVKSAPQDTTGDKPDIQITALGGRVFLVEIKWLGCNDKDTKHDLDWLAKAFKQLSDYLIKQSTVTWATLVAYDGRTKDKFIALTHVDSPEDGCKMVEDCKGVCVPTRGDCMVLFLEHTSASQS
jgi:hypothetical protein